MRSHEPLYLINVEIEERLSAKKLTDRRDGESAPFYVWRRKKKSVSTKEAVTEKSAWNEGSENRKRSRKTRQTVGTEDVWFDYRTNQLTILLRHH